MTAETDEGPGLSPDTAGAFAAFSPAPEETPELFSAALLEFLAGADRQVVASGQNTTMTLPRS